MPEKKENQGKVSHVMVRPHSPGGILTPGTWVLRPDGTSTEDKSLGPHKWGFGMKTPA